MSTLSSTTPQTTQSPAAPFVAPHHEPLVAAIEHAAHLLPTQGPITVFVHHNTLHAFEHLPFEEAVREAHHIYGAQPYLLESWYRDRLRQGRIRREDLEAVLSEDTPDHAEPLPGNLGTLYHLRLAMLENPLRSAPDRELDWVVAETDALRRFQPEASQIHRESVVRHTQEWIGQADDNLTAEAAGHPAIARVLELFGTGRREHWPPSTWESFALHLLWELCLSGVQAAGPAPVARRVQLRHRDLLLELTGHDSDEHVDDLLIRFCAAYLDQGFARWELPVRDGGLFESFVSLYQKSVLDPRPFSRKLAAELRRIDRESRSALDSITESLGLLGVPDSERETFISQTLLALPGWAGMIRQMETNAAWTSRPALPGSLAGFLAVRLILERVSLQLTAREALDQDLPLRELRSELHGRLDDCPRHFSEQRAFAAFQLAQMLGWTPETLWKLTLTQWQQLLGHMDRFDGLERRRVYHQAFERRYRNQALDALVAHSRRRAALPSSGQPETAPVFQIVTCIDDREESFRRHLEEVEPRCQTFGTAGFYAVAMYYRGVGDANFIPLCPVIIQPRHYVIEEPVYSLEASHRRRAETRRMLGQATHQMHLGSRSFVGGMVTALLGPLISLPMVTRILFPRLTARLRKTVGDLVNTRLTLLELERVDDPPAAEEGHYGYSIEEMAGVVERVLRDIGLTSGFSRLIILTGHGSSSLNNPHESAYNCGACSGGRGGPNARAYAQMANSPRVRALLRERGLELPYEVVFVGAFHNTCDDSVTFFDLDRLPATHRRDFEQARQTIEQARERNSLERCRRFESASFSLTPEAALCHVEARSEDLSQARPEYNHATNALCFVGSRAWSRGLYLDRRAFLQSYDPAQDDEQYSILNRILQAVIPVCAGISLEYYFSTVDEIRYGCGSKLPHNITSLLGVMEGAASDLRTGLSSQMVEIHEPLRILFVIETTPEAIVSIMDRNPAIDRLVRNRWVQLATIDPATSRLLRFRDGVFEPYQPESTLLPEVESSYEWYRDQRDHLGFVTIREPQS